MPVDVTLDFETRSERDIKRCGSFEYARDPSTSILCMSYKIDKLRTKLWSPVDAYPADLAEAVYNRCNMHAHNSFFECWVWYFQLVLQRGWPPIRPDLWFCSAASAAALSLPRNLHKVGEVLRLPILKDPAGQRLITDLCSPRKPTKKDKSKWNNDTAKLQKLYDYCVGDTETEACLEETIPPLIEREQATFLLDAEINARGIPVDMETVNAALAIATQVKGQLNHEVTGLTGGDITAGTQVQRIQKRIQDAHPALDLPNLQGPTIDAILEGGTLKGTEAERLLEIRQQSSKASLGKYQAIADSVGDDGRVRGTFLYYGANTGRWSGKGMQPHNFPRAGVDTDQIEALIQIIRSRDMDLLQLSFGDPLKTLSIGLRNMIQAKKGKRFIIVDFSAIEARVLAWLTGEEWKMQAFRDFDTGVGEDIYNLAAKNVFDLYGLKVNRQVGKVIELAFGYQGAVGAWSAMAKGYNVDLGESEGEAVEKATRKWVYSHWTRSCTALEMDPKDPRRASKLTDFEKELVSSCFTHDQWTVLKRIALAETIKDAWRASHPTVVKYWKDCEAAAIEATTKGGCVWVGKSAFYKEGRYLKCRLPCGRCITYCDPKVEGQKVAYDDNGIERFKWKQSFRYMRARGKQWFREFTYGGSICENITQGVARDLLVDAMFAAEAAGYKIVLHVHDEIVAEVDEGFGSAEELEQIMSVVPEWATGCPVAAAGFESERYRK